MGLRSWLTPATSYDEFKVIQESIEDGPQSLGIEYVLFVEQAGLGFEPGTLIVAWSGEGSSSIDTVEPIRARKRSWLLDNWIVDYPEYHDEPGGPERYGTLLTSEDAVRSVFV